MQRKSLVSIIIVNWNGKQYLEKCFSSLYKQNYKYFEVIFVDNASKDDSVAYVKKKYPNTKVIVNKKNLGFADANNVGYRAAKGEYILFLNNDTHVTSTFLSELLKIIENDTQIAGVQSKILLMDDPERLDSVGAFLTNTGFLYHYGIAKKDSKKYSKQIEVYSAKGACMLFRKSVLKSIEVNNEILDSDYFAYFEETDMCHRVWLAGYRIVFVPSSIIYHKMGGTSGKLNNIFVQYHSFKNRINSYIKNLNTINLVKILLLHLLFCELFALISLGQKRFGIFIAVQKAVVWNILNIKVTLRKRRYIQNEIRKMSDGEIFPKIQHNVGLRYYYYLVKGLQYYNEEAIDR